MILPEYIVNRNQRRKIIKPIKEKIKNFAEQFDMNIENIETAGRNESKQYIYNFEYNSIFLPEKMNIKLEIGLRFRPLCETITKPIIHKFLHPFTNEPLFKTGM